MQKIIQHKDETIYELGCSSEDLAFWSSFGFKPYLYDKFKDSYSIRKVCPFKMATRKVLPIDGEISFWPVSTKG